MSTRVQSRYVNDAPGKWYWKRYRCEGCGDLNPPTINCPGFRGVRWEAIRTVTPESPGPSWLPSSRLEIEGVSDDVGS